jgi:hypothetical protein
MPRPDRPARALIALPLLLAFGCAAPGPATLRGPLDKAPSVDSAAKTPVLPADLVGTGASTSLVFLAPARGGDTPFSSFILSNKNPDPIRGARHWPGLFGTIERLGPDDVFRPFPPRQGYCLTVAASAEIAPGARAVVSELPLMGGEHVLPPGRYRFVVPHYRASDTDRLFAAMLPFEVRGLDPAESEDLVRLAAQADVRSCPDVTTYLLETVERFAAPEVLPRLFELEAESLDERARVYGVLVHFPEHVPRLASIAASRSPASLAAALVLVEERTRGAALRISIERLSAALLGADDPALRVVEALGNATYEWTPEVAPRLVARLSTTRSKKLRIALAYACSSLARKRSARTGARP